jgi:hypothetical protein
MAANPIPPEPTIKYPAQWTQDQYTCACGTNVHLHVEHITGMAALQVFRHCAKDKGDYSLPIIAAWEEREGTWVRIFPA